jgi:hypothetical protein
MATSFNKADPWTVQETRQYRTNYIPWKHYTYDDIATWDWTQNADMMYWILLFFTGAPQVSTSDLTKNCEFLVRYWDFVKNINLWGQKRILSRLVILSLKVLKWKFWNTRRVWNTMGCFKAVPSLWCVRSPSPVQQSEECVICGFFPNAVFVDFCARFPRFLQRRNLYK